MNGACDKVDRTYQPAEYQPKSVEYYPPRKWLTVNPPGYQEYLNREHPIGTFHPLEVDPNGKAPHQPGAKLDQGKPRMSLVLGGFSKALLEVSKVGTFGAAKYTDNGWKDVPNGQGRYTDALYRHLAYEGTGEVIDPDSNLLHAAHTAWNALARLEFILKENKPC